MKECKTTEMEKCIPTTKCNYFEIVCPVIYELSTRWVTQRLRRLRLQNMIGDLTQYSVLTSKHASITTTFNVFEDSFPSNNYFLDNDIFL